MIKPEAAAGRGDRNGAVGSEHPLRQSERHGGQLWDGDSARTGAVPVCSARTGTVPVPANNANSVLIMLMASLHKP